MNRRFKPTFERPFDNKTDNTYISDGGYIMHNSERMGSLDIVQAMIEEELASKNTKDNTKEGA